MRNCAFVSLRTGAKRRRSNLYLSFPVSLRGAKRRSNPVIIEIATRPSGARNDTHIRNCERSEAISYCVLLEIATPAFGGLAMTVGGELPRLPCSSPAMTLLFFFEQAHRIKKLFEKTDLRCREQKFLSLLLLTFPKKKISSFQLRVF